MNLSEFTHYSSRYNELSTAFFNKIGQKPILLNFDKAKNFSDAQRDEMVKGLDDSLRKPIGSK